MKITATVWKRWLALPPAPPEWGGIFGGDNGIVREFCYDNSGPSQQALYCPNVTFLNNVMKEWDCRGISFYGIVHSHMEGQATLSQGDIRYIRAVMAQRNVGEKLYFPLVLPGMIVVYAAVKTESAVVIEQEKAEVCF